MDVILVLSKPWLLKGTIIFYKQETTTNKPRTNSLMSHSERCWLCHQSLMGEECVYLQERSPCGLLGFWLTLSPHSLLHSFTCVKFHNGLQRVPKQRHHLDTLLLGFPQAE